MVYPLETKWGDQLEVRLLEIGTPEYYEALMAVEAYFEVPATSRSIPTLVVGDQIMIGESEINDIFPGIVSDGIAAGGISFPDIEGVDPSILISVEPANNGTVDETCDENEGCEVVTPIYIAYFYQTGCDVCSRVEADLNYLKSQYSQLMVIEFNIYDSADLAAWMTEQVGFSGDFQTPALFIGDYVLVDDEILPESIIPILEEYKESGTEAYWLDYNASQGQQSVIDQFKNMGWLTVVAAGLIDGINPCAFATLIFFVLTDIERPKGEGSPAGWWFVYGGRFYRLFRCWFGFISDSGPGGRHTGYHLQGGIWPDGCFLPGFGRAEFH